MTTLDTTLPDSPTAPRIPLTAPVNLRDLGGIAVDGGTVRTGVALRADDLSTADQDTVDALVAGGLRAVVDLRSADEVAVTGRGPLATRSEVTYHHVPFLADIGAASGDLTGTDGAPDPAEMMDQSRFGAMYLRMFEGAAAQIVTALAVVAHSPGAVAFHCAAGQDRTGVLAAALLLALGADEAAIVADYARTGESSAAIQERLAPVMAPLLARFGFDLDDAARAALRTGFSREPMRELLAALAERHGDPLTPLRAAGLTDGLVARLRERALVGPGAA
ncbi:tyrosine-protein phosphatase [Isoptericola chiayiensis]|uniref:Tyrosine-protein phosphatase n=1 Tax=Isoptericola chiayiensis TaxID=579446 RepID=A0ABP8Y940_9MICO|nr:protein-tyrosine phosphatase [Isoptericola chiayiensis]